MREEGIISVALKPRASQAFATGSYPGHGTFACLQCGSHLALREDDRLPECPRCGDSHFILDSIFESRQDHGESTSEHEIPMESGDLGWLAMLREGIPTGARRLVCRDRAGKVSDFHLELGWTRIGRSVTADIRLDDPSVSRRHALVVSEPRQALRVLDDRSLNGVYLNGELVEWGSLSDGDELSIGCFHLFVVES